MTLSQRLDQSRQRLVAALISGDDTSAHRAAIDQITADIGRQAEADQATRADDDRIRQEAIAARASAITDEARRRLSAEIATLDMTEND